MDPRSDSASLFSANAIPLCPTTRQAAAFVLQTEDESQLANLLTATVTGDQQDNKTTVAAIIGRVQTRAQDVLQRDILEAFIKECPSQSPLRDLTGSPTSLHHENMQGISSKARNTSTHLSSMTLGLLLALKRA